MRRSGIVSFATAALLCAAGPGVADVCEGVSPVDASTLVSVVVENGLTGRPLLVTAPPDDTDRIFIVEQDGLVWVKHRGTAPGVRSLYLDVSSQLALGNNEQGLLGMAFAPDFATSEEFYVSYTRIGGVTVVARFRQDAADPDLADPVPLGTLVNLPQPQGNHNGGHIQFGPDGYLYLGLGDGGNANDSGAGHSQCGNGQDAGNLLGAMIRIDPTGNAPDSPDCGSGDYTVPTNPFSDGAGGACDEIWAIGLRNPWRWDFDPATGDLYIADVGQNCWEEINWIPGTSPGGENYGWRVMEASHCFNGSDAFNCDPTGVLCPGSPLCNAAGLVIPVLETSHAGFTCSITGGHVYRGCRIANLQGRYFWGDYCDGGVNSFLIDGGVATEQTSWSASVDPTSALLFSLTSFGKDAQGEIYIVDRDGEILKITPPLSDFEVSGLGVVGADQLRLGKDTDWTWEDLAYNAGFPIEYYGVYRADLGGTFDCVHSAAAPSWSGDPADPAPGQVFAYVVTAVQGATESSPGAGRTLGVPCAAP